MKIVIPVAGVGSRLKPHTHTTPKPLIEVAGKPMLDYVIEEALKVNPDELIFVVGYKKEAIIDHISTKYPKVKKRFVEQHVRDGDGSAVRLALQDVEEESELVVFFGDTLIDFNLQEAISAQKADAIVFAMEVVHPQHYGVLEVDSNQEILSIEEKPIIPKSSLAIIGTYYFSSLQNVRSQLLDIYRRRQTIKGEYKLAQVLNSYVRDSQTSIKASKVKEWFDCGRPEILLDSNRYFLKKKSTSQKPKIKGSSTIVPPCFIAKDAIIENSTIGPYVSVGSGTKISNSMIQNSIISHNSELSFVLLDDSIIGREVIVKSKSTQLNIGEKSTFILK